MTWHDRYNIWSRIEYHLNLSARLTAQAEEHSGSIATALRDRAQLHLNQANGLRLSTLRAAEQLT